jgi:ABC-type transport system involved in Fe-S cluster assembly fused permease/ATPase subunit
MTPPLPGPCGGVDLFVQPGRLAAIVGASGAGKTTISYLVPRLYDPTRGVVSLDGADLCDLTQESIVAAVGMVNQESYLFHALWVAATIFSATGIDEVSRFPAGPAGAPSSGWGRT